MSTKVIDYSAFQVTEEDAAATKAKLADAVRLARTRELAVEKAKKALETAQAALDTTLKTDIPELMDKLGKKRYTLPSGTEVVLKEAITANIKEANREAAFKWLRDNKQGAIIKEIISVPLPRGQNAEPLVAALREHLKAQGLDYEEKESVHAQTLGAFVREYLINYEEQDPEADEEEQLPPLPEDLMGVYRKREAVIN